MNNIGRSVVAVNDIDQNITGIKKGMRGTITRKDRGNDYWAHFPEADDDGVWCIGRLTDDDWDFVEDTPEKEIYGEIRHTDYDSSHEDVFRVYNLPSKVNRINVSYDGGRMHISVNGEEVFSSTSGTRDCNVSIDFHHD